MFPHGILLVPSSTVRSVGACNSRDYDGKVMPEEVGAAAALLRDSLCRGEEGVKELIQNLAKDTGVREAGVVVVCLPVPSRAWTAFHELAVCIPNLQC